MVIAGFCLLILGLGVPVFTRIFVDNILVTNVLPWKGQFHKWALLNRLVEKKGSLRKCLNVKNFNRIEIELK